MDQSSTPGANRKPVSGAAKRRLPGVRHVPIRTCVVCGNKTAKAELTRIVSTPLGSVEVDTGGKMPGRGAYVCGNGVCMDIGIKKGRLEHALRAELTDEDLARIITAVSGGGT